MHATDPSDKDDEVVCPKACLLFCYTFKSEYIFFTKRVTLHTFMGCSICLYTMTIALIGAQRHLSDVRW